MKKEDIKSIFLIFFILVLIVTISIFGINIYMDIMSMGMSNDYYYAILEGANMVRVGSAIFGKR